VKVPKCEGRGPASSLLSRHVGYIDGMSQQQAAPNWGQWVWTTLGWEGCLPLVAASSRAFLPWLIGDKGLAMLIAVFFVPLIAALVRAHRGKRQLESLLGRAGVWRQMVLAGAILALVVFEAGMAILIGNGGAGAEDWAVAAVVYFIYLILVALALWPVKVAAQ
jgi:hypothetical protein